MRNWLVQVQKEVQDTSDYDKHPATFSEFRVTKTLVRSYVVTTHRGQVVPNEYF